MSDIKCRFALGGDGTTVSIDTLDQGNRKALGPYTCPGCAADMIPVLGDIRVHHFRHANSPGSCESYLHAMTKIRTAELIEKRRLQGRHLTLVQPMGKGWIRMSGGRVLASDLSDLEQSLLEACHAVEVEKRVDGVVPDVCLQRSEGPFFVEICCSHGCEPAKLDLGYPIIEMEISSESDAERVFAMIEEGRLVCDNPLFTLHNCPDDIRLEEVPPDPVRGASAVRPVSSAPRNNPASEHIRADVRYRGYRMASGAVTVMSDDEDFDWGKMLERRWKDTLADTEIVIAPGGLPDTVVLDIYAHRLRYTRGRPVKTCQLCRHHDLVDPGTDAAQSRVRCEVSGERVGLCTAVTCQDHAPFETEEDLHRHRVSLATRPGASRFASGMVPPPGGWETEKD